MESSSNSSGSFDGFHNLIIPGAATQVAGDRLLDLLVGRLWLFLEQHRRGHHKARRAITTLHCTFVNEGLLHWM
jgi:hypothetical protein